MRPSDLPDVMLIERRSFTSPWEDTTFRGLMRRPSAGLSVAQLAGRVVGYSVVWYAADEGELGDLAVLPEHRGLGIGGRLLKHAIRSAAERGASVLHLEVRESNRDARRLYERVGFEVTGVRRKYYASPVEDAIVMRLDLQDALR